MYNGYVQSYSVGQQLENLIEQIPQEHRARITAMAMDENGNPYDTVRELVGLVMCKAWTVFDDPRTPAERDLDEWQWDWQDTYASAR